MMRVTGAVAAVAMMLAAQSAWGRGAPESFADLADALRPAVVNVSTTETLAASADRGDDDANPFEQFFKDYMQRHGAPDDGDAPDRGDGGDQGQAGPDNGGNGGDNGGDPGGDDSAHGRRAQSLGSGFVIDPSGIIVTNNHVIDGAEEITVTLQDNTVLKAKLIGHDDRTDIAVLKVEPKAPLPAVHFGDSDHARVGDWVLAIGNPFGLGGTVTAGIVSARGRDIQQGPYDDFIQTDAPINRGNSGGPLFNLAGEVVGINTAIYSPSGGSIGIGFAIPSNEARMVVDQLRRYGHTRRGWLGVRIQQVTSDIADAVGLPDTDGALVAGITGGGPADRAHIQNGDVIRSFDGKRVREMKSLPRMVAETDVGRQVPVEVWRQGQAITLTAQVAELKDDSAAQAAPAKTKPKPDASLAVTALGLRLAPVSDELRKRYKLDDGQKGAVVTEVSPDGLAADRGIRPGFVVIEVQNHAVASPAEVLARLKEARAQKRKSVLLLLSGPDGLTYVPVPAVEDAAPASGKDQGKDQGKDTDKDQDRDQDEDHAGGSGAGGK